jgi:diacylglycerol kinase
MIPACFLLGKSAVFLISLLQDFMEIVNSAIELLHQAISKARNADCGN